MHERQGKLNRHMCIRILLRSVALAAGIATAAGAPAQSYMEEIQERNASTYEAPWEEKRDVDFPPPPTPDNLVALDAQIIGSGYEYFVDTASVRLGDDQVLRYVVVVASDAGATATYFEGIRCETSQVKTYGFVTRQGAFKPLASSRWMRLPASGPFAYRYVLANLYMCDRDGWPISEKQVLKRLARNRPSGVRLRPAPTDMGK